MDDKPSFKLVGAPCGHHGQYTFYKALRLTGTNERIFAIGDFFFVRIWQDSELVSIGELQLLWTDRVSDQTLVSLRLYFLPENTPDGRNLHGEDEVLAINDKVVLRAEDLLTWVSSGQDWTYGLRAVWRGACAPPADARHTSPLHRTKLDFSDVDKEKSAIVVDEESPGVVVFSYPRYCRYRALLSRLEGIQADWLRDSLVAALGGYAAPTKNTRILYCKDTFEYPELEGHEFVCNHLAPKLKGRPRGRRRRPPRSRTQSPESRSSEGETSVKNEPTPPTPRRLSLRNGLDKRTSDSDPDRDPNVTDEDKAFLRELKMFYRHTDLSFSQALSLKHLSLRAVYNAVGSRGGYEAMCRHKLWRALFSDHPTFTRRHYERYLLPYEKYESRNGIKNGAADVTTVNTIDVIDVADSPPRDVVTSKHIDSETGEVKEENLNITSKPAEELNREFLDSLKKEEKSLKKEEKSLKITVKPVEKLIVNPETTLFQDTKNNFNELANKLNIGNADSRFLQDMSRTTTPAHVTPLNGHSNSDPIHRPIGRSSLRAVRVKPQRLPQALPTTVAPPAPESAPLPPVSTALPAVTNFGIHHPPPRVDRETAVQSDDEIVEVPYKPKTPEIIDLDEYPESPQSVKKKKLDILKERGLEVTPLPAPWPTPVLTTPLLAPGPMLLNPAVQHQIMSNAQLFQMYNIIPNNYNGVQPPKVIQASPLYGTTSPEKTVYGNPKDPFMPPPHVLHGVPIKPLKNIQQPPTPPQDILDLTCKLTKPTVEIVRVPNTPSPSKTTPQNLSKNYSIVDGKAVVGSNLEITLVNKAQPQSPKKHPQKRSSNGKFTKTPTPPKEYPKPYKKQPIVVPNYQAPREDSPTSSNSSQNSQKTPAVDPLKGPMTPFLDPYMALYSLAGQMDPRQLAAYREIMANQFRYSGLLNMGVNPTTKN